MKDIQWTPSSPECVALLLKVREMFSTKLIAFVYKRYADVL